MANYDDLLTRQPLRAVNDHIRVRDDIVVNRQNLDRGPLTAG
jgi:hypothetical protein